MLLPCLQLLVPLQNCKVGPYTIHSFALVEFVVFHEMPISTPQFINLGLKCIEISIVLGNVYTEKHVIGDSWAFRTLKCFLVQIFSSFQIISTLMIVKSDHEKWVIFLNIRESIISCVYTFKYLDVLLSLSCASSILLITIQLIMKRDPLKCRILLQHTTLLEV